MRRTWQEATSRDNFLDGIVLAYSTALCPHVLASQDQIWLPLRSTVLRNSFSRLSVQSFIHSLLHSCIHSFLHIHSFIHPCIGLLHPAIRSFIDSFTYSFSRTLICSSNHSRTQSFINLLRYPCFSVNGTGSDGGAGDSRGRTHLREGRRHSLAAAPPHLLPHPGPPPPPPPRPQPPHQECHCQSAPPPQPSSSMLTWTAVIAVKQGRCCNALLEIR